MPHHFRRLSTLSFFLASALSAQTYTPKAVQLEGADGTDQAQVLRLIDLKGGAPVTKAQIEAAMQRLADSGLFADLSYTVSDRALVFLVKPIPGAQALPVRFANFVWWQPAELQRLVEARVPLFHGTLPLTGQLTAEVEAALTALLTEKGVAEARVETMQSQTARGIALRVAQPEILVGQLHLEGIAPAAAEPMRSVTEALVGRDFDADETPTTWVNNTVDRHHNAGYLDVTVDAPTFSAPQKTPHGYAVDGRAVVHAGNLYRVGAISYVGVDPKLATEVATASEIKTGEPAGEMTLRIGEGLTARVYARRGMLDAKATAEVTKDPATHTVAYRFDVVPGPAYALAALDLSALPTETRSHVQEAFHARTGQLADAALQQQIAQALAVAGVAGQVNLRQELNRREHTVVYQVVPKGHRSGNGS